MEEIIDFWFNELQPEQWFIRDDKLDELIRNRFSPIYQRAIQCELWPWRTSAIGRLAEIIILDQFSRNLFRDNANAYAYDGVSLTLSQEAVFNGCHLELPPLKAAFMIMPYMHSESLLIHQEAVKLFALPGLERTLDYEFKHKAIIERFGRYPHRNKVLGRASVPEEIEFLKDNPGF